MVEVIDSATPLECELAGVRPRVYATAERFEELRRLVGRDERAADMMAELRSQADGWLDRDLAIVAERPHERGYGCALACLALCARITRDTAYVQAASRLIHAFTTETNNILSSGHFAYGMGIAYDWLHDELDDRSRCQAQRIMQAHGNYLFDILTYHRDAAGYTSNAVAVALGGLSTAAGALFGDLSGIASWARCCVDRARAICAALGPDGASHEGITYGEYFNDYFVKSLVLVRDLLGVDLFRECDYLRQLPLFYLYSSLPRPEWTTQSNLINFGDGVRYHWYGPGNHLRVLAKVYGCPRAQWHANAAWERHVEVGGDVLGFLAYDPAVPAQGPEDLPPCHHFADKGIVFQRSGWDGNESVLAFKCGPHFGHRVLGRYTGEIGGGHMNPNSGSFQLYAHGERMISGDGYFYKRTEYQNTLLVNGIGQEGENSQWFESLVLRREQRGPRMLFAGEHAGMEVAIGDVTDAYRREAHLKRFVRHVYRVAAHTWVIVDDLAAEDPASFELLFHSDLEFKGSGSHCWTAAGERGRLRLSALAPASLAGKVERQPMEAHDRRVIQHYPLLRLANLKPMENAVFVTVLEAQPADGSPDNRRVLMSEGGGLRITVAIDGNSRNYLLSLPPDTSGQPALSPI